MTLDDRQAVHTDPTMTTADIGHLGLMASGAGAIGYLITIALPDGVTGFWGVAWDVLTLWGWGPATSLGLVALAAILGLVAALSAGFTRAPRWLVTPLLVVAIAAAAPILLVLVLVCTILSGGDGNTSRGLSEF